MPGVQIIQIVPWHLRLRNLVFPRLVSEAQVYPGAPSRPCDPFSSLILQLLISSDHSHARAGFFDAPGSHLALLPPRVYKGPLEATIAFCCIDRCCCRTRCGLLVFDPELPLVKDSRDVTTALRSISSPWGLRSMDTQCCVEMMTAGSIVIFDTSSRCVKSINRC